MVLYYRMRLVLVCALMSVSGVENVSGVALNVDNPAAPLLPQHWPIDVMKTDGGHSGHTEEETSSRRMQEVHDHMIVNYTLSNCEQIDHCGTYVLRSLNTLCSSVYGHS